MTDENIAGVQRARDAVNREWPALDGAWYEHLPRIRTPSERIATAYASLYQQQQHRLQAEDLIKRYGAGQKQHEVDEQQFLFAYVHDEFVRIRRCVPLA